MSGVYFIYEHWRPDLNVCFYVGKGKGARAYDMRRGRNRHHKFIQEKLNDMGMSVEVRIVLSELTEQEALSLEMEKISSWREKGIKLANVTDGGDGTSGVKRTSEQNKIVGDKLRGRNVSTETRMKLSIALKGNKNSLGFKKAAEVIEKTAKSHRGKVVPDETRERISIAAKGRRGRSLSSEHIESLRKFNTGRKHSEEAKEKMRKPKSAEHRAKLSAINIGKRHSEKTKKLLSEKARLQWVKNPPRVLMDKEL